MHWYEAAAWGFLGGLVGEILLLLGLVFYRSAPWRYYFDWPGEVVVSSIRALLGAIVSSAFNLTLLRIISNAQFRFHGWFQIVSLIAIGYFAAASNWIFEAFPSGA